MDEKEKTYASKIFKICRTMARISGIYFNEQISKSDFLNLFAEQMSKLNAIYLED